MYKHGHIQCHTCPHTLSYTCPRTPSHTPPHKSGCTPTIKTILDFFAKDGDLRVILCEITHSKNESLPIVFILSTLSAHPMRFHNPEYQPPMTSGSRVKGCKNFVNFDYPFNELIF